MAEHSPPEPTTTAPADDIHLTTYSRFKTSFTKLDVELTGRFAGLANNKGVLVYDLEEQDKRHNFSSFQGQGLVGAIKWNPHYNRRMHLASALGQEVIVWDMEDKAFLAAETRHRDTSDVLDICWSRFEENIFVSAGFSHSVLLWDTRAQKPAREFEVGTNTTRVSFNRKNGHILASTSGGQVWVWDTRKAKRPVVKINATDRGTAVTSLDWSYENQYDLLTSGGGDLNVKLWSVGTANPEQGPSYINIAADQRTLQQPVKRVLFVPMGQAAITTSRGELEARHELQTIKMWSLDPTRRFQLVNTFTAGSQRIIGVCFRALGEEAFQYQVASLDAANHLRLHDIEGPRHFGTAVDLPPGTSSAWREEASTAGSESLEGAITSSASVLKDDLIPPVWSKLAGPGLSTMAMETSRMSGGNAMREIIEVERLARLGAFDPVSDVRLHLSQRRVTLVMLASAEASRLSSIQAGQEPQRDEIAGKIPGAPAVAGPSEIKYLADAGLRVTAKAPLEYRSRDEPVAIRLESTGGSVTIKRQGFSATANDAVSPKAPLDEDTLKRLQVVAEDVLRQAPKSRQSRLEASLLKLRRGLTERVRDVAKEAAGLAPRREELPLDDQSHQSGLQFVFDEIREAPYSSDPTASTVGSRDKVIDKAIDLSPRAELASAVTEAIVPCPRRFGATFAPGGTLVVFSSSLAVIRAQTADAQTMDAQTKHARTADDLIQRARSSSQVSSASAYPRTFGSFLQCLKKIRTFDIAEESHDEDLQEQLHWGSTSGGIDESRGWLRPWGPSPGPEGCDDHEHDHDNDDGGVHAWEDGEGDPYDPYDPYDMEAYSSGTERSSDAEDSQTHIPYNYGDSTRLPISHPDHSLGPGLGPATGTDNDTREDNGTEDSTAVVTDVIAEGHVPWTPKPKQVMLVDCSRFLPGSRNLAASYNLGRFHRHHVADFSAFRRQDVHETNETHEAHDDVSGRPSDVIDPTTTDSRPAVSSGSYGNPVMCDSGLGAGIGISSVLLTPPLLPSTLDTSGQRGSPTKSRTRKQGSSKQVATGVETLNHWVPSVPINGSIDDSIDDSMASMASMALQVPINRTLRAGSSASGGYWGNIAWSGHDLPRSFVFAGGNQGQWELSGARRGLPPRHGKQAEMEVETEMAFSRMGSPHHDMPRYHWQAEHTAGGGDSGTQDRTPQPQAKWINSSSSNDSSSGVSVSRSHNILQSRSSAEVGHAGVDARNTEEYCAYLCRYNAAVATGCGCPEQASFWALLAVAVDKEACSRQKASSCSLVGARWHAGWKGTATRSIEKALRYFENIGDPQMLASVVCVLSSASKGGGYGTLLPQGQENVSKYNRYLASYAEQLYQWSAHRVRTEIISRIRGGGGRQKLFSSQGNIAETSVCDQGVQGEGWLRCSLCGKLVGFAAPACGLCGHGGHSLHMKSWFATESECPYDGCKCLCWMDIQGEWDDVIT